MKGLKELKQKISQRGFQAQVNKAMKVYVKKVVQEAKQEAPTQITYFSEGYIRVDPTSVGSTITGSYQNGQAIFDVADPQGPYIEFGTGRFAAELMGQRPKEWQDLAWEYFKTGKGILMSNPYMYPAITENEKVILEELQKNLND